MKKTPISILIIPFILLLFSGVSLQYLYTKEIANNNGITPEKLTKLKSELSNSDKERKIFNLVKSQNEVVVNSNETFKVFINVVIELLWSIVILIIIHFVVFWEWWKNRYNKAIKKDV